MDKSTLHGFAMVMLASASLTLPWLMTQLFGRRRSFDTASPRPIAAADRALAHYGSWAAIDTAAEVGDDGIARITVPSAHSVRPSR